MSANVLIALSGLRSEPIRRLAHWLIWQPPRFFALMIVAGLEYRLRRRKQPLSQGEYFSLIGRA